MTNAGETLDRLLPKLGEVRNLVHGVYAQKGDYAVRLETLRAIDKRAPNLQLVLDMAVFWWTSAILAPLTNCRPGKPPWALS